MGKKNTRISGVRQARVGNFHDPAWIFELKYDGWRALAYVTGGRVRLM